MYLKLSALRKSAALQQSLAPPTLRAPLPMQAIQEVRDEISNPVHPYPSLRDAKVGQVYDVSLDPLQTPV